MQIAAKSKVSASLRRPDLRHAYAALAAILAFVCVAASAPTPLRVGTSGDYSPFTIEADGRRSGFDVDVMQEIAPALGRPLDFVAFRWPDLSEQTRRATFDLVASGVTIRPERALLGRFTRPYAVSEAVVLVGPAKADSFRTITDVDREDVRICVNGGGYLEHVARSSFQRAKIVTVADNRLQEHLARGDCDVLVSESIEARYLPPLTRVGSLSRDRKAIFVPTQLVGGGDSQQLFTFVDRWLSEQNREVEALRVKWFRGESQLDDAGEHVEAIAALIDQRSGLAPWIAAAKRATGQPIEDVEREKKVLAGAAERARHARLSEEKVVALYRALIEESKDIQRAAPPIESDVTLDALRTVLNDLDDRLIAELAASRDLDAKARERLRADIDALNWPGLTLERKREIAQALL